MNESKNLFQLIGDWWQVRSSARPHNSQRYRQWLPSPGNVLFTLLSAGLLIFTQQTWANNGPESVNVPSPSATTINYQGRLAAPDGTPKNGTFGMDFAIYDAASGGNLIWGPESHSAVPVTNGLFNVGLGSVNSGSIPTAVWNGDRYLQITVGGETLTPRELIRSVPIAGMALTVPDGSIGPSHVNLQSGSMGATGNLVLTTSPQVIPGAETTITVDKQVTLIASAAFEFSAVNPTTAFGYLTVDGTQPGRQAIFYVSSGHGRSTVGQTYRVSLAPGTHILRLLAQKTEASGDASVGSHTQLNWFLVGQ